MPSKETEVVNAALPDYSEPFSQLVSVSSITDAVQVPADSVTPYNFRRENGIFAMMDGTGSTVENLTRQMPGLIRFLVTSRSAEQGSSADRRGKELDVPVVYLNLWQFESERGVKRGDYLKVLTFNYHGNKTPQEVMQVRADFCSTLSDKICKEIEKCGATPTQHGYEGMPGLAAGWEVLNSQKFTIQFFVANDHPGKLTHYVLHQDSPNQWSRNSRSLVGLGWVPSAKAILAGDEELFTTSHLMTFHMDQGPIFMRGYPLRVNQNRLQCMIHYGDQEKVQAVAEAAQTALKHIGDYVVSVGFFTDLFQGNWGLHQDGRVAYCFQGKWYHAPAGIQIYDHLANNPGTPARRTEQFLQEKHREFYDKVLEIAGR